jgi:hypothetical protein
MKKEIATNKLLHPLSQKQRKELAEFCHEIKQVIENKIAQPEWFSDYVGLCSNFMRFQFSKGGGASLSLYEQFKEDYPFGRCYSIFTHPTRLAFIDHWAQKHLDYTAKKP